MPFVKVIKNKSYFSRFQVKFRRRREGKTDYQARKNMIIQNVNRYCVPKYRLVVRFTNTDVIAQIVYSKINGDYILSSAYSHELPRYGIKKGLTNYAAAYATGLLLARRVLTKLKLSEVYAGLSEATGEDYLEKAQENGPRPFYVLLDTGLVRTTTGNRVFAALKGAVDGGLDIPHSNTRFVGYFSSKGDGAKGEFDAAILRKYIYGGHVADYMRKLEQDNLDQYKARFSNYILAGITADQLESIYKTAHSSIRQDPMPVASFSKTYSRPKKQRLSLSERKARIAQKLAQVSKVAK